MSKYSAYFLVAVLASVGVVFPAPQNDAGLILHDRDDALVYEVGYETGQIHYGDADQPNYYDPSVVAISAGEVVYLSYWESNRIRTDHTFRVDSSSYASKDAADTGDAGAWVFHKTGGQIGTAVLALRNAAHLPVPSGHGSQVNNSVAITVPANSRACAVMIWRPSQDQTSVAFNGNPYTPVDKTKDQASYFEIANNQGDQPSTITVSGTVAGPAGVSPTGTTNPLSFVTKDIGSDAKVLSAKLGTQAARYAALVLFRDNNQQCK